jgi:hypothetical protein
MLRSCALRSRTWTVRSMSELYLHIYVFVLRAPVLVAIALVELGMKYEDAVELIRQ